MGSLSAGTGPEVELSARMHAEREDKREGEGDSENGHCYLENK